MVSKKYENNDINTSMLAEKILRGGNGSWGNQPMAPHPQLTKAQTEEMARYVLSLAKPDPPSRKLEVQGTISFLWDNLPRGGESNYLLAASYTDKGNQNIGPLKSTAKYLLRYPKFYANDFEDLFEANIRKDKLVGRTGSYFRLSNIDLTNIKQVVLKSSGEGVIEIRLDDLKGPLLGEAKVNAGEDLNIIPVSVSPHSGKRNLYFIRKNERLRFNEYAIEWVYFSNTINKDYK
jgi:cytochrome c